MIVTYKSEQQKKMNRKKKTYFFFLKPEMLICQYIRILQDEVVSCLSAQSHKTEQGPVVQN